jgi:hypothetical protein
VVITNYAVFQAGTKQPSECEIYEALGGECQYTAPLAVIGQRCSTRLALIAAYQS